MKKTFIIAMTLDKVDMIADSSLCKGIQAGIEGAWGPNAEVGSVEVYPFDGPYRPDYMDVLNDTENLLSSEIETPYTREQIVAIAKHAAEELVKNSEERNNTIFESATKLYPEMSVE